MSAIEAKSNEESVLVNPLEKYPRPPYKQQQQQPTPGSDAQMTPKADHGETSYKGSGKLKGRKRVSQYYIALKCSRRFRR